MAKRYRNVFPFVLLLVVCASSPADILTGRLDAQEVPPVAATPPADAAPDPSAGATKRGEAAVETNAASDEVPEDKPASILAMILGSGVTGVAFMVVLGLFSMVAVTVAVERAVNMRRVRIMPPAFLDDLEGLVRQNASPDSFARIAAETRCPMASVLAAGLLRQGRSLLEIEKSMEDALAREMAELRARIRPLSVVGSVAPLVGLLGTVVGMIIAFHTASQAGLGKAELLAEGIYMALLTTAGGLSVAIPALLLASFFNARVEKFIRDMDLRLMAVMPCLARFEGFQPSDFLRTTQNTAAAALPPPDQAPSNPLTREQPVLAERSVSQLNPLTSTAPTKPSGPAKPDSSQSQPAKPESAKPESLKPASEKPEPAKPESKTVPPEPTEKTTVKTTEQPQKRAPATPASRQPGRNPLLS